MPDYLIPRDERHVLTALSLSAEPVCLAELCEHTAMQSGEVLHQLTKLRARGFAQLREGDVPGWRTYAITPIGLNALGQLQLDGAA
jgi:hypothetical protein